MNNSVCPQPTFEKIYADDNIGKQIKNIPDLMFGVWEQLYNILYKITKILSQLPKEESPLCEKAEPQSEWIPVTVIVVGVGGVGGVDRYYTVGTGTRGDRYYTVGTGTGVDR